MNLITGYDVEVEVGQAPWEDGAREVARLCRSGRPRPNELNLTRGAEKNKRASTGT